MVLVFAFISGIIGSAAIVRLGKYAGVLDVPNERSSHVTAVPKGGGVGILVAFIISSVLLKIPPTYWLSASVLSLVSFFGDRLDINPKIRLFIQFSCALIFLIGLIISEYDSNTPFFLIPFLLVFIVGTANFYNFMDGINGIAGITGVIGFLLLAVYGHVNSSDSSYVILSIAIAFSCVGFLPFNFPHARVFMGDVGSVLLGFVYACMVVFLTESFLDFIVMASFLFPFYVDELTTMIVRVREGDKLTKPHRKHVYQILANECGFDHWKVASGYGILQLLIGGVVFFIRDSCFFSVFSFLLICFICYTIFSINLRLRIKRKSVL